MSGDWRTLNRANWDERVGVHVGSPMYDLSDLRAGKGRLYPIEDAELGPVEGLRVLHLQCHIGTDTLVLAQRGAHVTGLDFSAPAVAAARELAGKLGLDARARFVEGDVYAARDAVAEPASFDRVFVSWGAINWLPDIVEWARIVAWFLKPGGALYLAEGHPVAFVYDDAPGAGATPPLAYPYFERGPFAIEDARDYADETAVLENAGTMEWNHPLCDVVNALIGAGLRLRCLNEHDSVPWLMFEGLERGADGMFRFPDKPWVPLSYSLWADRPA